MNCFGNFSWTYLTNLIEKRQFQQEKIDFQGNSECSRYETISFQHKKSNGDDAPKSILENSPFSNLNLQ